MLLIFYLNLCLVSYCPLLAFYTGVIFGNPYFVTPSASPEIEAASDEMDQLELNAQRVWKSFCLLSFCMMNV